MLEAKGKDLALLRLREQIERETAMPREVNPRLAADRPQYAASS